MKKTAVIGLIFLMLMVALVGAVPVTIMYDDFNRSTSWVGNVTYPNWTEWHETPDGASESDIAEFYTDGDKLVISGQGSMVGISYYGESLAYQSLFLNQTDTLDWHMNVSTAGTYFWLKIGYFTGQIFPPNPDYGEIHWFPYNDTADYCECNWITSIPINHNQWYHYTLVFNRTDPSSSHADFYIDDSFICSYVISGPENPAGILSFAAWDVSQVTIDNFTIRSEPLPTPVIYDTTGAKIVAWTLAIILFLWIVPKMGRVN